MTVHVELTAIIANLNNYELDEDTAGWVIVPERAATKIIAAGYVKMPSREAIMRVLRRKRTRGNTSADGDSGATADLILALLAGEVTA